MKSKRRGSELQAKTFYGEDGKSYLVFRTLNGSYHAFAEVEAKETARKCGAIGKANATTRDLWSQLWEGSSTKHKAKSAARPKRNKHAKSQGNIDFASLKPNIGKTTDGTDNLFRRIRISAPTWLRSNRKVATEVYEQILAAGPDGVTTQQLSNRPKRQAAYRLAIVGLVKADTLDKDVRARRYRPI
jgi:hypothetical protein